jgi:hypothetical protein
VHLQELPPVLPLLVLVLCAMALAGCSRPVVVDLSPVGSSNVKARARFDWTFGNGAGRWSVRLVPNPSPVEATTGCIQKGSCKELGDAVCKIPPTSTFDSGGSDECSSPRDYAGTHALALRVGTCEGVVLACADL